VKNKNVTFSIPDELIEQLRRIVGKRGQSRFVAKAIEKAIEDEIVSLRAAYRAANEDTNRIKVIQDWVVLDNEDWGE
jgi:metal-responsive CopG/Arc/MetJ family transcriptional regulator